jgi:hypothetical protein
MGLLAWVMMGLAIWHFTIWLPDHFWGGIVGAFLGALLGAAIVGLAIHGFSIPPRHATSLGTSLEGIPGAIIGIGLVYFEGMRRERAAEADAVGLT